MNELTKAKELYLEGKHIGYISKELNIKPGTLLYWKNKEGWDKLRLKNIQEKKICKKCQKTRPIFDFVYIYKKNDYADVCNICRKTKIKRNVFKNQSIVKYSHKLKTKRTCLKCGNYFLSEGPHNRLCNECRIINNDVYDFEVFFVSKSHLNTF